ncbi:MAG: TolC family protein [Desulfobacterium sp.]|nr:TolC family protein [Desulfobacterium sp.]
MNRFFAIVIALCLVLVGARTASCQTLTLDQAFGIALSGNPSIQAASARIHQARERVKQARADFFPTLTATGNAESRRMSDTAFADVVQGVDQREESYDTGLLAQWTLFSGFETRHRHTAALGALDQAAFDRADVERTLLSAVAEAYFNAQLALKNRAIAQADKVFNQRQAVDADLKEKAGTGSLSDFLNFQIKVNAAQSNIESAAYGYGVALSTLAQLMGGDDLHGTLFEPAALTPEQGAEMDLPDLGKLSGLALFTRPDIKYRQKAVEVARENLAAARSGYWPTITLNAVVAAQRTGKSRFQSDDIGDRVSLGVVCPLFKGGGTRAGVGVALAVKAEAEKRLKGIEIEVVAGVRTACLTVVSAQNQLRLQRERARLVKENRDLVEQEYLSGQVSLVRLNEAQKELTTAEGNLALSLVALHRAWFRLKAATGTIGKNTVP